MKKHRLDVCFFFVFLKCKKVIASCKCMHWSGSCLTELSSAYSQSLQLLMFQLVKQSSVQACNWYDHVVLPSSPPCLKSHELSPFVSWFLSSFPIQCSYPALLCVLMSCSLVVISITLIGSQQSSSGLISWHHFRSMYVDGMWRDAYCHYKGKPAIVMIRFYTVNFLLYWGTLLWHSSMV